LLLVSLAVFHRPLFTVMGASLSVDHYSHILMVAPISTALIWVERKRVLAAPAYNGVGGVLYVAALAIFFWMAGQPARWDASAFISISLLLFAASSISAFLFCYGLTSSKHVSFALFLQFLMAPLPDGMLQRANSFLQYASAEVTAWFFTAAGVHFLREGVVIYLPTVTIEVAEECSGIRSSIVLFISCLVLAHLLLRSPWSKLAVVVISVPMMILKNGLRIFVLTMLGTRVDPSFLTGRLHHQGGIIFFAAGFIAIWVMTALLQRLEARWGTDSGQTGRGSQASS
jgi:exosortase